MVTGDKWSNPSGTPLEFRLYLLSFCYVEVLAFLLSCLSFPSCAHGDFGIPSRGCGACVPKAGKDTDVKYRARVKRGIRACYCSCRLFICAARNVVTPVLNQNCKLMAQSPLPYSKPRELCLAPGVEESRESRGSSSLPLQEGFPRSPACRSAAPLPPRGRGKPYVRLQKCSSALPNPWSNSQVRHSRGSSIPSQHSSSPTTAFAASPGCTEVAVGA